MTSFKSTRVKSKLVYKILAHILTVFLITEAIVSIISQLIFKFEWGIYEVVIALFLSGLIIYNTWFKDLKKHKQYIRRAEKYIDVFDNKEKAIEILKKSLNINNLNAEDVGFTSIEILYLYLEQNKILEAEEFFYQALNSNFNEKVNSEMMFQMAIYYSEHGQYFKATQYFDRALNIAFKYPCEFSLHKEQVLKLIETYIKDNQRYESKKIYNKLLEEKIIKKSKKVEKILDDID